MSWPLVSDFSRMLQNPKLAFRDLALRECRIELDALGQPRPRSGNFATVYKAFRPDGSELAVRVFNRRQPERMERYEALNRYLESHPANCLVGFDYDDRGIRSGADGKLYPLLTMDWVPGVTLFEWARDRCREGYREALAIGADVWLQLIRDLEAAKVVHGDLQHGNVLVSSEGYFKLVDYDCMGVPELMGGPTLETGLPPYQHPGRSADTPLFSGLDNFSALVIYVALRALAADPGLWFTFVEQPGYDRLLFRSEDFQRPGASPLYQALMHSADEQVRDLSHYLFQLTTYDVRDIPPVDEVLLWCNSLENLLAARDWDTAIQLVDRMGEGEQIAPQFYDPALLDNYPGAEELAAQARISGEVRRVLEVLAAAMRFRNWDHFLATWQANQHVLVNRPSAAPFRREVKKLLTVESLKKLLGSPRADDQAVIEAWNYLRTLGGHERAEPFRGEIARRMERQQELPKLQRALAEAPSPPTMKSDRLLTEAWNPDLFDGYALIAPLEQQVAAARQRLEKVRRLSELAKKISLEGEQEIMVLGGQLPEGYHPDLSLRVQRARQRLKAYQRIHEMVQDPRAEASLVEAFEKLVKLKGEGMLRGPIRQRV